MTHQALAELRRAMHEMSGSMQLYVCAANVENVETRVAIARFTAAKERAARVFADLPGELFPLAISDTALEMSLSEVP